MGLCGSAGFFLRERAGVGSEGIEEGIGCARANNGDVLGRHFGGLEHFNRLGSVWPAGAEIVGEGSGLGPAWAACESGVGADF